jgi:hypothetical protein
LTELLKEMEAKAVTGAGQATGFSCVRAKQQMQGRMGSQKRAIPRQRSMIQRNEQVPSRRWRPGLQRQRHRRRRLRQLRRKCRGWGLRRLRRIRRGWVLGRHQKHSLPGRASPTSLCSRTASCRKMVETHSIATSPPQSKKCRVEGADATPVAAAGATDVPTAGAKEPFRAGGRRPPSRAALEGPSARRDRDVRSGSRSEEEEGHDEVAESVFRGAARSEAVT